MQVAALAAERDLLHISQRRQQRHPAHGEILRRCQRICRRQFDDQVHTALHGKPSTGEFVQNGGISTLDKVSAHDGNNAVRSVAAHLFQMVQVSVVQRIVFTNDTTDFHAESSGKFMENENFPAMKRGIFANPLHFPQKSL